MTKQTTIVVTGSLRVNSQWLKLHISRTNFHGPKNMFEPLKFDCRGLKGIIKLIPSSFSADRSVGSFIAL